jgi:hypothetical protein
MWKRLIVIVVAVAACKKSAPASGAGSGLGSAVAAVATGSGTDAGSGSAAAATAPSQGSADAAGSAGSGSAAQQAADAPVAASERAIAGLDLEMKAADVRRILGAPTKSSKPEKDPADEATYWTTWTWASQPGLKVTFTGETTDELVVHHILVEAPSTLKTPKGIGIGATREEVLKAYGTPDIDGGQSDLLYGDLNDATTFAFGKKKSRKAKTAKVLYISRSPIDDAE